MSYFHDLTKCDYSNSIMSSNSWNVPFLAIGWLEAEYEYPTGPVSKEVLDKLRLIHEEAITHCRFAQFRGLHTSSLSSPLNSEGPIENSDTNILIPTDSCIYVGSGGLVHYIEKHQYLPPEV